jgi:hypothetical protein
MDSMVYLDDELGFTIQFRDGQIISFKICQSQEDLEQERNDWMVILI